MGYIVFFMSGSIFQLIGRQVRKTVRPFFLTVDGHPKRYLKPCYDISTWLVTMGTLNMLVPCFDLLYIPRIMQVWRQIYYSHFLIVAAGTIILHTLKPTLKRLQKKRVERYEQKQKLVERKTN